MTPSQHSPEERPLGALLAPDILSLLEESPSLIAAETEELHPADLADVAEAMPFDQVPVFLAALPRDRAAQVLEYLDEELRAEVLEAMTAQQAAALVTEMTPDERADVLEELDEEHAEEIVEEMPAEARRETEALRKWEPDSAGGIMTTDYISVPDWATIEEVIEALRARAKAAANDLDDPLPEGLQEIYIVSGDIPAPVRSNGAKARAKGRPRTSGAPTVAAPRPGISLEAEGRLEGMVSLRDLLLADPDARIADIAHPTQQMAHPLDNERDVAHTIADDDLLALPVVDDQGALLGIVTVDDAIDVILPTAWKKRIPRLFH